MRVAQRFDRALASEGARECGVAWVPYAAGQRDLTVVCCHDTARVVWAGAGRPPRPGALLR